MSSRRKKKEPNTELSVLEQETIVQEARDDISLFFLLMLGDVMDIHPFTSEMLHIIQKFTDKKLRGLIIAAGPRSGKTVTVSQLYAAWELGRSSTENIALVSYSEDRSVDNTLRVRDLITSKMYKQIFPGIVLDKSQKAKTNFRVTKGGEVYALGRNSPVTGRTFHKIIIDDIIKDANEMNSESMRASVVRSMETLSTRITNKTRVIVIGTRWYEDDPIGFYYKEADKYPDEWLVAKFPAVALEDETSIVTGKTWRKRGEALMPIIANLKVLAQIKDGMSPAVWESVYQQQPPTEEVHFRRQWIRYTDKDELRNLVTRNYLTIDPAMSTKESADRTGFCINMMDTSGKWHVKAWGERLDPRSLVDRIFSLHDKYHFELIGIEKFMFTEGLKPFVEDQMVERNAFLPFKGLSHSNRSKEARIIGALPGLYAHGVISHVKGECEMLESEMFTFPRGDHDDILDAISYMAIMLTGMAGSSSNKPEVHYGIDWTRR